MSNPHSTRPKDSHSSWVVQWTGKNNEVPTMTSSNWAPGYTPAHCETQGEALAHAMAQVTREIALVRQKWISLTMMLDENREEMVEEMHNIISDKIAGTPGLVDPIEYDGHDGPDKEDWDNPQDDPLASYEGVQVNDAGERWTQEEIDALEKSEAEAEEAERQRKGHPDYDPEEDWLPRD